MELIRGVCSLCSENTRVLTSSDAEEYSKFLPNILYENFLPEAEFQKIKGLIKICVVCCYKIQIAIEVKDVLSTEDDLPASDEKVCCFCKTDKSLMQMDKNWKNFLERTEGYLTSNNYSLCTCPKCFFYFDAIYNFKTKLTYKFPQLATQKKKSQEIVQKQGDTPKRKSLPKSPPSSKKRKIFDNCFSYLQPLCNYNYQVDDELKLDKRLYKKIAYVNLKNAKDVSIKETPKMRPIIKIKLKPRNKKGEKDGSSRIEYHISKPEEVSSKSDQPKSKRRLSQVETTEPAEEVEEKLEETPKSAIVSNLVPKRRVSQLIDNGEKEEKQEDNEKESKEETKPEENTDETATDEHEQSESPEEPKEEKSEELDKNGIDKSDSENVETNVSLETPPSEDVVNGEKSVIPAVEATEEQEIKKSTNEDSNSSDSSNTTVEKTKTETSSEGSDSDSNDLKDKNKGNSDTDVLNGSERKKKRVTFSDEINN
ncbi:hypothetical protein Zmor_010505 [Zophobas morio]|uniref:Uncharacterized protein n=1 Tax=Zophobas morio TaxID=2755281 RepID=A0AA38ISX0_9CUCU|nr:hypothetical protein Zmor_010505 [Zophobas morio]